MCCVRGIVQVGGREGEGEGEGLCVVCVALRRWVGGRVRVRGCVCGIAQVGGGEGEVRMRGVVLSVWYCAGGRG